MACSTTLNTGTFTEGAGDLAALSQSQLRYLSADRDENTINLIHYDVAEQWVIDSVMQYA